jgi:hypothetical protein
LACVEPLALRQAQEHKSSQGAASGEHGRERSLEAHMDITTILVIVLIVVLLGGGGFYGRGRWY